METKGADQTSWYELDSQYFEQTPRTACEGIAGEYDSFRYKDDKCCIETLKEVKVREKEVQYDENGAVSESLVQTSNSLANGYTVQVKTEDEGNMVAGYEKTCDLEALRKPGRKGWLREVVYSRVIENLIVNIYYIPPGGKTEGKNLLSRKNVQAYLIKTSNTSTLTTENFAFKRKVLGLGNGWEVSRMSNADCTQKKPFKQFFKVIEGSSPPQVSCKLCDGKSVSYENFTRHMVHYHLPDKNCPKCLKDIPAGIFRDHNRVCDGTGTKSTAPQDLLPLFSQYYTSLKGTSPARVSCNLCDGKSVSYKHFTRHMRFYHLPDETCSTCFKDIPARIFADHTRACTGSATSPVPNSINYSNFLTKVEGTQKVACNLCDGKHVGRGNFSRHFKRFHINNNTPSKRSNEFLKTHSSCSEEKKSLETKQMEKQDPDQDTDYEVGKKRYVKYPEEKDQALDDGGDPNQTLQSDATIADTINLSFSSSSNASEIYMCSETESE